ncbi:MAG TPA: hypothetical protein VNG53_11125 [Bacteroidia bacterium]|nr:hypothetical protein [Bacteroidia bacterium]
MSFKKIFFCFLVLNFACSNKGFSYQTTVAPTTTPAEITVTGTITSDDIMAPLVNIMVINKRTSTGEFANVDGTFSISIYKTDTLLFTAQGYTIQKICLKDSVTKPSYKIAVHLHKLEVALHTVNIFPIKSLDEVQKEINEFHDYKPYDLTGISAISSPITALYERFSKFERSKREVAALEHQDQKDEILKELFRIYVKSDIIQLNEKEFDAFIAYCNLSDEFIQTASEFDLVMAIKKKYESFSQLKAPLYEQTTF